MVSNSSTEKPISAAWAATSVATVDLTAVDGSTGTRTAGWPARPAPSRPGRASAGPFQCSQRAAASAAKCAAWRSRSGLALAGLGQLLLGERPDGLEQAVPGPRGPVVGDHQRLADQRVEEAAAPRRRRRPGDGAQGRQVEAPGEDRRRPQQSRARRRPAGRRTRPPRSAGSAADRGRAPGPVSSRNRSPSRSRTSAALIAAIRAAASSMPRGSPSSVSQISTTAAAVCSSKMPNPGRTATARSTNRVTASEVTPRRRSGAGPARSPRPASAGARATSPGTGVLGAGEDSPIAAAAAATRCSQLSTTISRCRPATASATVSRSGVSPWGVIPSAWAIASGTASGVPTGRQLDQPHPVREPLGDLGRGRQGEPGLAHAADTAQGHQLVGAHPGGDRGQLALPPDQGRGGPRQVAAPCLGVHAVSVAKTEPPRLAASVDAGP